MLLATFANAATLRQLAFTNAALVRQSGKEVY